MTPPVSSTKIKVEGRVIEIRRNMINVSSFAITMADKQWSYTDKRGHLHGYAEDGTTPTLKTVPGMPYWCVDCHDEHTDTHTVCTVCMEEIRPGTVISSSQRSMVAGMTEFFIDGKPCTEAEARAAAGVLPRAD